MVILQYLRLNLYLQVISIAKMSNRLPQYKKLYEQLRKQIEQGVYKEGDLLPSENDLCRIHNLTRPTIRQALNALVNDGYIKKQQGKGSIVDRLPFGVGILSISGTTSVLGKQNLQTKILVAPKVISWPEDFIYQLSDSERLAGCIYMERLRLYKEKPIFLDINYLPNINLPRFTSRNHENKSLFDTLRKYYQVEIKGGEQRLRAIPAGEKVSSFLEIKNDAPVLHLDRKIATNKIDYYIYSSIYCNTEVNAIYGTF